MLSTTHRTKFSYLRRVLVLPISAMAIGALSISTTESKAMPVEAAKALINAPAQVSQNDTTPTPAKKKAAPVAIKKVNKEEPKPQISGSAEAVYLFADKMTVKKSADTSLAPEMSIRMADQVIIERPKSDSTAKQGIPVEALYIYDGRFISYDEVTKLNPSDIKSINVWKGESAVKKFGQPGAHGVIELFSKKIP